MTDLSASIKPTAMTMDAHSPGLALRSLVIGLTAFLTVVDLFATQAILPSLTRHYGVTPAAMGFAVNASTFGMAIASLVVGFFSRASTGGPASCSASRCWQSPPACWRPRQISRFSPLCGSRRACAWHPPSR